MERGQRPARPAAATIKSPGRYAGCLAGILLIGSALTRAAAAPDAPAVAEIGRKMFFDPALSASGKLACSTCHDPKYAYGPPPGLGIAVGGKDMKQPGTRAVPSLRYLNEVPDFNEKTRFTDGDLLPGGGYTWDGRAPSIAQQASIPLLAANEMANANPLEVVAKLKASSYAAQFRECFGADVFEHADQAYAAGLAALAAFQHLPTEFYPFTSRYDAFLRGDIDLSEREERGVALFKDPKKGNCASCHLVVTRAGRPPVFTDYDFTNVGVPRNPRIAANADPAYFDLGLCGPARQDLADHLKYCGLFRAPTLRNVALRDAFFHNGAFTNLRDVMHFYVERDLHPEKFYPSNADGTIRKFDDLPAGIPDNLEHDVPFNLPGAEPALSNAEIEDVIAFLNTLTDGYSGS
jgi:cytochrome c peroxidase